jgi:tRNA G18 (ribose-2'-O)-methylase SpoU
MKKKTIWDMNRVSVDEFKAADKLALTVVLDNVRSLNNIGSIFRTCDGFAVKRIMLCGISATPPSPEIHKTALGAEDSVDWIYCKSTADALDILRGEGCIITTLEQVNGSVDLRDFNPDKSAQYALIVGNEVDGVDQSIVDACDLCIEIPQDGTKHSLNVAVSTAIAIWHFYTKLKN